MATGKKTKSSGAALIIIVLVAVVKYCTNHQAPDTKSPPSEPQVSSPSSAQAPTSSNPTALPPIKATSGWHAYAKVTLDPHHNNDGDSFHVRLPDGKNQEFRLYFVDTPESQFKRYRDGNTNAERIAQQAKYFGNISPEASTALGKKGKEFTRSILTKQPFELYTRNEEVYDSGRYYCHIRVNIDGKPRWLDELLVEKGYARIITQPADLPDGTKADKHRQHLRKIESQAKQSRLGGWQ